MTSEMAWVKLEWHVMSPPSLQGNFKFQLLYKEGGTGDIFQKNSVNLNVIEI